MRTTGVTNPIPIVLGIFPLFLFYSFVQHTSHNLFSGGAGYYFLLAFMFTLFVVGPILLLASLRLIVIDRDRVKEIYLFRLTTKMYSINDLKSTFTQNMTGNSLLPLDFGQTYLYFGQGRRIRFNALEFINYRTLRNKFEEIEKAKRQ